MAKIKGSRGLMINGSLRTNGITTYMRNGKMIVRASSSMEKRSNTPSQFMQRQKMRHAVQLWKMLKYSNTTMFTQGSTAYGNFVSLANRLPVVYVTKGQMDQASFLMPGIPVSDGTLPELEQHLGEVDGTAALITSLKAADMAFPSQLLLYTAVQTQEYVPRVRFNVRKVAWQEMTQVDGHYVLKGEEFADEMKGWALVLVRDERCSPQTIVTRCTLYQSFTTTEALQAAAKSYGGLTDPAFLRPR